MKKLLALVLVAVMAFSCLVLASCGDKKEETSTASENSTAASADESKAEESATSTEESAASADESAVSEEATSEEATSEDATSEEATSEEATSEEATSEEATSEEATSEDVSTEGPEEIKETATYKFFQKVNAIDTTNGVSYMMVMGGEEMAICILGDKVYAKLPASIIGADMTVIIKDGATYSLNDAEKTYAVAEGNPFGDDFVSSLTGLFDEITAFDGYEYVSTTTEEVEGVTYTVETFKFEGELEKCCIDANGNVVAIVDSEGTTELEFDGEGLVMTNGEDVVGFGAGVIDGCFDIPADYTEVSAAQ